MIASAVLGSLYCTACLVLFLGVKEQPGELTLLSPLVTVWMVPCGHGSGCKSCSGGS